MSGPAYDFAHAEMLDFEDQETFWRQRSEPVKVHVGSPTASAWTRQMSEPVKVHMTSTLEASIRQHGKDMAGNPLCLDEDEPTTAPVTPDSTQSASPRTTASPASGNLSDDGCADPLLPRWVGQRSPSAADSQAAPQGLPGPAPTRACTMMLRGVPEQYTEAMLLEELRDAGFLKGRDFDFLLMPTEHHAGQGRGSCVVNFLNVAVSRAFMACFQGRATRNFQASFAVTPCTDQDAQTLREVLMLHLARMQKAPEVKEVGFTGCPRCNREVHCTFNFCTGCGTPLKA